MLSFQELLQLPAARVVLGIAGLLVVTVVGTYVVLKYRDSIDEEESPDAMLTRFREMRHEGYLDEAEYRTIRTDLERQLSQQSSAEPEAARED